MISRFRPACPIIALCQNEWSRRQLAISWGVHPYLSGEVDSTDRLFSQAVRWPGERRPSNRAIPWSLPPESLLAGPAQPISSKPRWWEGKPERSPLEISTGPSVSRTGLFLAFPPTQNRFHLLKSVIMEIFCIK